MVEQVVQIIGSLLVLTGFAAAQLGRVKHNSPAYLGLNVVGSGILAVLAFQERQWGFLLLEGTWCMVSVIGLTRVVSRWRSAEHGRPGTQSEQ